MAGCAFVSRESGSNQRLPTKGCLAFENVSDQSHVRSMGKETSPNDPQHLVSEPDRKALVVAILVGASECGLFPQIAHSQPQAGRHFLRNGRNYSCAVAHFASGFNPLLVIVLVFRTLIFEPCGLDAISRPVGGPFDPSTTDEVMRPAWQPPAADRRMEGSRLPVVDQLPIGRRKRRDHLLVAPTATQVPCSREFQ